MSDGFSLKVNQLALGQRISVKTDTQETQVIEDTLNALTSVQGNPYEILQQLFGTEEANVQIGYDASSKWLIGAGMKISSMTLDLLFDDKSFYGILVEFEEAEDDGGGDEGDGGDDKGGNILAGLRLEILYRKINDHLGVYSGDLTLPTKFQTISLAAATLHLPSVSAEIYTNGDFKVSIGWPLGENSFMIAFPPDPIPWSGRFALYFAKLHGEDLGGAWAEDFGLIIEFGVGISIGAASEGNFAIVSYSANLYLNFTFQGMLGWQNGSSLSDGINYTWFAGSAGISGHLEGSVDFVVIKASLSLDLSATIALAIETDHQTTVQATFEISVTASVKVLFVKIHFTFHATLTTGFSLGSGATQAQITGPTPPGNDQVLLETTAPRQFRSRKKIRAASVPGGGFTPQPKTAVAPNATVEDFALPSGAPAAVDTPAPFNLYFLLQPTLAENASKSAAIATLIIERSAPGATSGGVDDFETLAEGMTTWLLTTQLDSWKQGSGYNPGDPLTQQVLDDAMQMLDTQPLTYTDVISGLNANSFSFSISGATPATTAQVDGALFPMIPELNLYYPDTATSPTIQFNELTVTQSYLDFLTEYFSSLSYLTPDPAPSPQTAKDDSDVPIVQVVFAEYFGVMAKQMIGALQNLIPPGTTQTTADLADDLDQVDYGNVAGSVSRFMQNGLVIPTSSAMTAFQGLYELTSQQFLLNATPDLSAKLELSGGTPDIPVQFATTAGDDTDTAPTSTTATLEAALTTPPTLDGLKAPAILDSLMPVDVSYVFSQGTLWTDGSVTYSLSDYPQPLTDELVKQGSLTLQLSKTSQTSAQAYSVNSGTANPPIDGVALLLARFRVAQVADPAKPGSFLENIYQVYGTDDRTRDLIDTLLAPVTTASAQQTFNTDTSLKLLLPQSGGGFETASTTNLVLLKNNLSTATEPDNAGPMTAMFAEDDAAGSLGPMQATLSDASNFLRLLWEVSVVHTGGFFLQVDGLDSSLFSSSPQISLGLAVQNTSTSTPKTSFSVAQTTNAVCIDSTDLAASERLQSTVFLSENSPLISFSPVFPPGSIGLEAQWTNAPLDPTTTAETTNALYQLFQFQLQGSSDFTASPWSLPLSPKSPSPIGPAVYNQSTWTGTSQPSSNAGKGNYSGTTSTQFTFTAKTTGTVGTNAITVDFTSQAGGNGTITVDTDEVGVFIPVADGLSVAFTDGTIDNGSTFTINVTVAADWDYTQAVPVYKLLTSGSDNPYNAVGKSASFKFNMVDVFGNTISDSSKLPALNNEKITYSDEIIPLNEWPATLAVYDITGSKDAITLKITISFQTDAIDSKNTAGPTEQYKTISNQISDPSVVVTFATMLAAGNVTMQASTKSDPKTALADYATQALTWLGDNTQPAPTTIEITGTLEASYVDPTHTGSLTINEDLFTMWVLTTFYRKGVDSSIAAKNPLIQSIATPIPPDLHGQASTSKSQAPATSLTAFAGQFEAAYEGFVTDGKLKVMSGKNAQATNAVVLQSGDTGPLVTDLQNALNGRLGASTVTVNGTYDSATEKAVADFQQLQGLYSSGIATAATSIALGLQSSPGDIWALRWGTNAGIGVAFANSTDPDSPVAPANVPAYFAPTPLSTQLLNGTFEVQTFNDDGTVDTTTPNTFVRVDLDNWASGFLNEFEGFLTPQMAASVAQNWPDTYDKLMACKDALADAISQGLANVFVAPPNPGDRDVAVEEFRQSLLSSLSSDYTTSSLVQVPAAVSVFGQVEDNPTSSIPPNLFGNVYPSLSAKVGIASSASVFTGVSVGEPALSTDSDPYANATVRFNSGANAGAQAVVKSYDYSTQTFTLSTELQSTPQADDAFTVIFQSQEYSMSTATATAETATEELTFSVSAVHPSEQAEINPRLFYSLAFLEHNFLPGEDAYDYVPSSWLRFVLTGSGTYSDPALDIDMGPTSIPIPLRAFPPDPTLISQNFTQTSTPSTTIADALEWDYHLTIGKPTASQDELFLTVTFNEPPEATDFLGISPSSGAAGSKVRISGEHFSTVNEYSVMFGTVAATNVTVINEATLIATVPQKTGGSDTVEVTLSEGGIEIPYTGTGQAQFTYTADAATTNITPPTSLFEALARFQCEYYGTDNPDKIQNHLSDIQNYDSKSAADAQTWLNNFAQLVQDVTDMWSARTILNLRAAKNAGGMRKADVAALHASDDAPTNNSFPAQLEWQFKLSIPDEADTTLTLEFIGKNPSAAVWPTIEVNKQSYTPTISESTATYNITDLPTEVALTFVWEKLDIVERQSANTRAFIERNADLGSGETNSSFIYTTPTVEFPSVVVPLLIVSNRITEPQESSISAAISDLFKQIMPSDTGGYLIFSLQTGYAFQLNPNVPSGTALEAELPVFLTTAQVADAAGNGFQALTDFENELATNLSNWHTNANPSSSGASLYVNLTLFATISEGKLPLARISDIELPIGTEVDWWNVTQQD